MSHSHSRRGCTCQSCLGWRAYQRQWHRDQRALKTAYAARQQGVHGNWLRRARQDPSFRNREQRRQKERYLKHRFVLLMYHSLRRLATVDPVWPWHLKGISESDREKLMRVVEAEMGRDAA